MELEHLRLGEERSRSLRELHHEDCARREVRRVEQTCIADCFLGQRVERVVRHSGCSDHAIDAGRKRLFHVSRDHARLREIHEHVEAFAIYGLLYRFVRRKPGAFPERIDSARDFHVISSRDRIDHRRPHPPGISRNCNSYHVVLLVELIL